MATSILRKVRQAIIYSRVSSEEQLLNMSMASQEAMCRDYCARHGY